MRTAVSFKKDGSPVARDGCGARTGRICLSL